MPTMRKVGHSARRGAPNGALPVGKAPPPNYFEKLVPDVGNPEYRLQLHQEGSGLCRSFVVMSELLGPACPAALPLRRVDNSRFNGTPLPDNLAFESRPGVNHAFAMCLAPPTDLPVQPLRALT